MPVWADRPDLVVVGAGSAGCALAGRLAERGLSVLLLEAGPRARRDPRVNVPAFFAAIHGSRLDWAYRTEPQPELHDRRLRWPRGRVVGGSSATNYLVFLRGHPDCYDAWARAGCPGWSFADVLPYFRRLEDHELGSSRWHGAGGPVRVASAPSLGPLGEAFLEACESSGIPRSADLDGERAEGAARYWTTIRDGRRESAATAYLERGGGPVIRPGMGVTRVLLRGGRVVGVEAVRGRTRQVIAADHVALCAGAVASPAILLRSGLGRAAELERLGIAPVASLPGVGRGLADHLAVPVVFGAPPAVSMPAVAMRPSAALAYLRRRKGPWASNVAEVGAILRTDASLPAPDLQLTFGAASFVNHGRARPQGAFSMSVVLLQPRSRGRMRLATADPTEPPLIDPVYLSERADLDLLIDGVDRARRIAAAEPLARWSRGEREPGASIRSRGAINRWIRARAETSYHPVGTCRMGQDDEAVVDPHLRVRGVDGLYVADASVMPQIVSANTNAACMMIGERAADLLVDEL